jgi:dihydrofolate reductase
MTTVYTSASMSLDGYIGGHERSSFEYLFRWMSTGDVEVQTTNPGMSMRMTQTNAEYWRQLMELTGALVVGRDLFDMTGGWGGEHPMGKPVVVLTHRPPADASHDTPFTFVSEGIEAAIEQAKALAGDLAVGLNGGTIATQALNAGLLDEIWVDLAPVLLGGGRSFFDELGCAPVELDGPVSVVDGEHVTHLRYRVRRA